MWLLTACKISVSLWFLNWIKNEMIFYHISEQLLSYRKLNAFFLPLLSWSWPGWLSQMSLLVLYLVFFVHIVQKKPVTLFRRNFRRHFGMFSYWSFPLRFVQCTHVKILKSLKGIPSKLLFQQLFLLILVTRSMHITSSAPVSPI